MTNYTYEQRQMIAEYLQDSLEVMNCYHDRLVLCQKIKKLLSCKFGDIKNKVGTKFKMLSDFTYTIVKRYENDEPLILDSDNNVYPLNYLNDDDLVEVIK